jgi:hypothetical protein
MRPSREPIKQEGKIPAVNLADAFEKFCTRPFGGIVVARPVMDRLLRRCEGKPYKAEMIPKGKFLPYRGADEPCSVTITPRAKDQNGAGILCRGEIIEIGSIHVGRGGQMDHFYPLGERRCSLDH